MTEASSADLSLPIIEGRLGGLSVARTCPRCGEAHRSRPQRLTEDIIWVCVKCGVRRR